MSRYQVIGREEGSDEKKWVEEFDSLAAASKYIEDRWQGPDYMDGVSNFHTDHSTYELVGFTLKDIGKTTWGGEPPYLYREYEFFATLTDADKTACAQALKAWHKEDEFRNTITPHSQVMFVEGFAAAIRHARLKPFEKPADFETP